MSAWPTLPALFVRLLVAIEYAGHLPSRTPRTPKWPAWCWILGLVASYAGVLAVIYYAAGHETPMEAWRALMPLPVVDKTGVDVLHADTVAGCMLLLAACQSYALLALYRSKPTRIAVLIGCGAMLLLSCSAPVLISFDLYSYVQHALLGSDAYRPTDASLGRQYHFMKLWYGHLVPADYGPLWLVIVGAVTALAPTLLAKIVALRIFAAVLFLCMLAGLRALGMPARMLNVAALNPGLMLQFVSNGHNDLILVVLLVWTALVVRSRLPLAFALIAVAGLIKLPFAVLGLPLVATTHGRVPRFLGVLVMLAAVGVLSLFFGGSGYIGALVGHLQDYPDVTKNVVHQVAGGVALALIALAALGGRRLRSAVWIFPMFSAAINPWYFVWGLPYALARRRILSYLLVCFPFVSVLIGLSTVLRLWELNIALPIVVIISVFGFALPFRAPAIRSIAK